MEERQALLEELARGEASVAELCRRYGVSRTTANKGSSGGGQFGGVPHHPPNSGTPVPIPNLSNHLRTSRKPANSPHSFPEPDFPSCDPPPPPNPRQSALPPYGVIPGHPPYFHLLPPNSPAINHFHLPNQSPKAH